MLAFYVLAVVSFHLETLPQCLTLILLGYWYNDLRGADLSCLVCNFINGCGFICFSSGAMQVAIGGAGGIGGQGRRAEEAEEERFSKSVLQLLGWWFVVIACMVFSTVQTQDMADQRGDAARNRKMVPLVIGDAAAWWTITVPVLLWCWATPWLWRSSIMGYIAPVFLGLIVAVRILTERSEKGDKNTFRLWNLWLVSIYLLPLIKAIETYFG